MAYYRDIDAYNRCDHNDQEVNEWSENIDISPWRIDPLVHQQHSFNGHYNLVEALPRQLSDNFTPYESYSMIPDTCPPYYSSSSTLYDSSSSSSSRPSPPVDSPASSFLRTPELYHRDILIPPMEMNPYTLEREYGIYSTEACVAMPNIQMCADGQFEETMDDFSQYETVYEPQELVPSAREEDESSSTPYYHYHYQIPLANVGPSLNTVGPNPKTEPNHEPNPEPKETSITRQSRRSRRVLVNNAPLTTRSSRITKRPSIPRKATSSRNHAGNQNIKEEEEDEDNNDEAEDQQNPQAPLKSFPCPLSPYGCTASFSAKNEWKRHAATQHFRLGFWRCDLDLCTPQTKSINSHKSKSNPDDFNDFNRKDLFIQHVRRMHSEIIPLATTTATSKLSNSKKSSSTRKRSSTKPPTTSSVAALATSLSLIATRCHRPTHSSPPPPSLCVFCNERFEGGAQGLESRLEHMGKHMDSRRKEGKEPVSAEKWKVDEGLEGWLVGCGVLVREGKGSGKGRLRVAVRGG